MTPMFKFFIKKIENKIENKTPRQTQLSIKLKMASTSWYRFRNGTFNVGTTIEPITKASVCALDPNQYYRCFCESKLFFTKCNIEFFKPIHTDNGPVIAKVIVPIGT